MAAPMFYLIARRPFRYHGGMITSGQYFEAPLLDAIAIQYRGQARLVPKRTTTIPPLTMAIETPEPDPASIPEPEPAPIQDAPAVEQDSPAPEPKRRRTYKRRDLTAEPSE